MESTTRNRALPLIIRSYASSARSKGKISFMDLTLVNAQKDNVSWESIEAPEGQPTIDRLPKIKDNPGI
jgi:hypothetical protein